MKHLWVIFKNKEHILTLWENTQADAVKDAAYIFKCNPMELTAVYDDEQ